MTDALTSVLITDDDFGAREWLKTLFEGHGFDVVGEAADQQEAVKLYKELRPDFVTMDLRMPRGGGLGAIKAIKAEHPEARIIVVSAVCQGVTVELAKELGVRDFVDKPIRWSALEKAISSLQHHP